jgi:uncharacterized protein YdhG (YjbR/CyaY superfamily)
MADSKVPKWTTHDEYIATFSPEVQERLKIMRKTLSVALFSAEEVISYGIPAFRYEGELTIYYSAYTKHVSLSFYPTEETYAHFAKELENYTHSKSAIQFPLDTPLPTDLIGKIAKYGAEVKLRVMAEKKGKKK